MKVPARSGNGFERVYKSELCTLNFALLFFSFINEHRQKERPTVNRIYLDNAATTAICPEALAAMLPCFGEHFGNASSIHSCE